jgi:hypothetical protein
MRFSQVEKPLCAVAERRGDADGSQSNYDQSQTPFSETGVFLSRMIIAHRGTFPEQVKMAHAAMIAQSQALSRGADRESTLKGGRAKTAATARFKPAKERAAFAVLWPWGASMNLGSRRPHSQRNTPGPGTPARTIPPGNPSRIWPSRARD